MVTQIISLLITLVISNQRHELEIFTHIANNTSNAINMFSKRFPQFVRRFRKTTHDIVFENNTISISSALSCKALDVSSFSPQNLHSACFVIPSVLWCLLSLQWPEKILICFELNAFWGSLLVICSEDGDGADQQGTRRRLGPRTR